MMKNIMMADYSNEPRRDIMCIDVFCYHYVYDIK